MNHRSRAIAIVERASVLRKDIHDDRLLGAQQTGTIIVAIGADRAAGNDGGGIRVTAFEQPDVNCGPKTLGGQGFASGLQNPLGVRLGVGDKTASHFHRALCRRLSFPKQLNLLFALGSPIDDAQFRITVDLNAREP